MKKLLIALLVLTVIYSCNTKQSGTEKEVKIKGKISQIDEEKVVIKYQLKSDTIKTDADGNFESTITIDKPCYVLIVNGSNEALTFLNPGISISFEADGSDFVNTLTFKDGNAEINNYLAKQNLIYYNEVVGENGFATSDTYEEFLASYNSYIADYEKNLKKISEKCDDKFESFKKAETEKLKLIKLSVLTDFLFHTWDVEIETPEDAFVDLGKMGADINIDNPDLMFFKQYWPFLSDLLTNKTSSTLRNAGISDCSTEKWLVYYFEEIDKSFKDKQVIEDVYFYFIKQFIGYYGPESITQAFNIYKDFSECEDRISKISAMLAEYDKIAPGKPSVEWSFPDIDGKNMSSADLIGKYVYIDVWASWCGPCKDEIPFLETLKKKLAGKNIAFISISVDDNIEDWKNSLKKESATGIQLYADGWDNVLCKHFKINSIPRFILLDRDGNIIKSDADRPSGDIEAVINALEGI
jgi:thiol-disulfide isomerase/thioredoxin